MISTMDRLLTHLASRSRTNVAVAAAPRSSSKEITPNPTPKLTLYEYEASPWCRLVREYATILDVPMHIRPCPRQTLFLEGAFDATSRFRPQAMDYLKHHHSADDLDLDLNLDLNLTFPLLVDETDDLENPVVLTQSYDILEHLWEAYGQTVVLTEDEPRPDQRWNSEAIPFPLRFLSLAAPTYFRLWPTCGLLQAPSIWNPDDGDAAEMIVLYQVEGCPESRLVRETLCTLELPYWSVPAGHNSSHSLPPATTATTAATSTPKGIPVLMDGDECFQGADACCAHLWETYRDPDGISPKWWNGAPSINLGCTGSFGLGAYAAFVRGNRAMVPPKALK